MSTYGTPAQRVREEHVIELRTDLTRELRVGEEVVRVSGRRVEVLRQGRVETRVEGVKSARVESGLGIGKLVVVDGEGREVEVAYFTKRREQAFKKLAEAITKGIGEVNFDEEREVKGGVGTLKWLWHIASPYKRTMIAGVALSLVATALNLVPPYLLKVLIDNVLLAPTHPKSLFERIIAMLIGSYLALAGVSAIQSYTLNSLGSRIVNDLREKLYNHVMNLDYSYVEKISASRILSRLTTDAGNTNWLMVWGLPTVVTNFFTLVGIGVILFTMDAPLALYILIPVPVIVTLVVSYRRKSHRRYHKNWRRSADMTSKISDTVPNHMVIRSFSREGFEGKRLGDMLNKLYESSVSVNKMNATYWPSMGLALTLATVMIWWVGGNEVIVGTIQLGVITAFLSYVGQFYGPINNLSNVLPFVQQSITSAERIREVMETKPRIVSPPDPKRPNLRDEIRYEGVYFGYDPFIPVVLDFNLKIRPGEKVAIVGRSGSGKSTIAKLLLRFYDVDRGAIYVGRTNLKEIDLSYLRSRVAYVPQDVVLFDDTVAYNVSYGSVEPVTVADVIRACKIAMIHDDVVKLPVAYDTVLGERGTTLSGGQRQRLSIARAVIKDPDMIIFDEATSNLDVSSEREVYRAIVSVTRGKTVLFITHNVHEVMASDRVVVMRDGRIVEEGHPHELITKKGGEFYNTSKDQINEENVRSRQEVEQGLSNWDPKDIFADPSEVTISPGDRRSKVHVEYKGKFYENLIPRLLFPISKPEVVGLYDDQGKEILILLDYNGLDQRSRSTLVEAVKLNNMVVQAKKIREIAIKGDQLEWDLITEIGEERVITIGRRNVMVMESKVVLVDKYDNVYEINLQELDKKSRKILDETL